MAQLLPIEPHPASKKRIIVLGATGTIGKNTLDIIAQFPNHFELWGISAHANAACVVDIVKRFSPRVVAISHNDCAEELKNTLPSSVTLLTGANALTELAATPCELLVHGIVGAAGIAPLHAALMAGNNVALANKESLVCAGHIMMPLLREKGTQMYPVDSEHNALFQLMGHGERADITRMTLTASGGPFLTRDLNDFASITPAEAVAHPNWIMGSKISVDSATMANKGLELMEAHYLFDAAPDMLDACIHPQSLVHALLYLRDGSVMAHLSMPDMRLPLAYALHGGQRPAPAAPPLDLTQMPPLEFSPIDTKRYPMYALARSALKSGAAAMAAYNIANEMAVQAFLNNGIRFTDIHIAVEKTLAKLPAHALNTLGDILAYDAEIRRLSTQFLEVPC